MRADLATKPGPVTGERQADGVLRGLAVAISAWFDAGPVAFAIEPRARLGSDGERLADGWNVFVFEADRSRDWLRFDCSDTVPHYHYLRQHEQQNLVWAFDPATNGPMLPWALAAIRNRLPEALRKAGADELAATVEREGFDISALDRIAQATAG